MPIHISADGMWWLEFFRSSRVDDEGAVEIAELAAAPDIVKDIVKVLPG